MRRFHSPLSPKIPPTVVEAARRALRRPRATGPSVPEAEPEWLRAVRRGPAAQACVEAIRSWCAANADRLLPLSRAGEGILPLSWRADRLGVTGADLWWSRDLSLLLLPRWPARVRRVSEGDALAQALDEEALATLHAHFTGPGAAADLATLAHEEAVRRALAPLHSAPVRARAVEAAISAFDAWFALARQLPLDLVSSATWHGWSPPRTFELSWRPHRRHGVYAVGVRFSNEDRRARLTLGEAWARGVNFESFDEGDLDRLRRFFEGAGAWADLEAAFDRH